MTQNLPQWENLETSSWVIRTAEPTTTEAWIHTTSLPVGTPTFIGDGVIPGVVPSHNASANAAGSVMMPMAGIGGAGMGGMGGLGMVTVLVMLYNLCAGAGLGVMLWKGVIDWKGNIKNQVNNRLNDRINSHFDEIRAINRANDRVNNRVNNRVDNQIARSILNDTNRNNITVTDDAGTEWIVPIDWVFNATERLSDNSNATDATVQLTSSDGNTGNLSLNTMLDAVGETIRMQLRELRGLI